MLKITFRKTLSLCLLAGGAATLITFSQTPGKPVVEKTPATKTEPVPAEPKQPALYSQLFNFRYAPEFKATTSGELHWDESFLKTEHWDKKPAGIWQMESTTETVVTYKAEETREFLGGPARLVKMRTDAKTGKILNIHITWINYQLINGFGGPVTNTADMTKREYRKWLKNMIKDAKKDEAKNEEEAKIFDKEIEAATKELIATLTTKFGEPKKTAVGKSKNFKVNALDFETKTGTTLRLYIDEGKANENYREGKLYLMASIYPTDTIQKNEDAVVPKNKRSTQQEIAAANVMKSPNGDVMIKNFPMQDQGDTGGCSFAATAMLLEYYGSSLPWEVFSLRQRELNATASAQALRYEALADAGIEVRDTGFSPKVVMNEIDNGRPVQASVNTRNERYLLHAEWREKLKTDPSFKLPKESRKEREDGPNRWARDGEGGHKTTITGYNKEKEILFMTESSGEEHRNYPISFAEFENDCRANRLTICTPTGKGKGIAKDPTAGKSRIAPRTSVVPKTPATAGR